MDKYDLVFDIIEHPESYPDTRLSEILADDETREIYNLVCKTRSTAAGAPLPTCDDVDAEWTRFEERRRAPRFKFLWLSGRAASVAVLLLSSLVAVAIGVVVKVTVFDRDGDAGYTTAEPDEAVAAGNAVAASDSVAGLQATDTAAAEPVLFEDAALSEIIGAISKVYGVKAEFKSDAASTLRLYYRFDPSNTLDAVVEQLNTFGQINIRIVDKTLVIE